MKRNGKDIISIFMHHPVAANLLMVLMLCSGIYGLLKMNVQFLPNFDINVVKIRVVWPGASADDVEKSIIYPIEKELRDVDNIKQINSTALLSAAEITIEFIDGTNMSIASEEVRDAIARVRMFPEDAEKPIIDVIEPDERVANLIIYGPKHLDELRYLAWQAEKELLDKGISKVRVIGLPKQRISIELNPIALSNLGQSFNDISKAIAAESQDIPAGQIGKSRSGQNLRSIEKKRTVKDFKRMRILGSDSGDAIIISDIAHVKKTIADDEPLIRYNKKPAVVLQLFRKNQDNTLSMARIAHSWVKEKQKEWGNSVKLQLYYESWVLIKERIYTLLFNGLSGLILIIILLFLFLNRTTALWVSAGIPVSVFASMYVLYLTGGSINMVSLFGFILTLGIIVDDTIVVGEQALTNYQKHQQSGQAIIKACYKMMAPILSSSLTTISAFIPLMAISGVIGTVLFHIPLVVICVILASLIECFFVLPGHLYHSFKRNQLQLKKQSQLRMTIDQTFYRFRYRIFKPFLHKVLKNHGWVMVTVLSLIFLVYVLFATGGLKFTFFPTPDSNIVKVNVQFVSGTFTKKRVEFLQQVVDKAYKIGKELDKASGLKKPSINLAYFTLNRSEIDDFRFKLGKQYGSVFIDFISGDLRPYTNQQFIDKLQKRIKLNDGIDNLAISSPKGGPPGKDIDIQINHSNINKIKLALDKLNNYLSSIPGVTGISDNLPFSQEQLIFKVNETGKNLGLSTANIGEQLRAAFNGEIVQTFNDPNEEIEVLVRLEKQLRYSRATLKYLPIKNPSGKLVPLQDVITIDYKTMPETIIHNDFKLSGNIDADVDASKANANEILNTMQKTILNDLEKEYGITYQFKGKAEDQAETLYDIKIGMYTAFILIYIILAWVFKSYSKPLVVMTAIPLGLIGAILGHWFMGLDLTLLSLFGLFGLSGIVINDSIILINEYQSLKAEGLRPIRAITEASSRRFRAILLTSITTIAGLSPLLFETSLQAQFLIPMACSIVFGLAFATMLLLLVVPVMIMYLETVLKRF